MSVELDILNTMLAAIGASGITSTIGRHPGLIKATPVLARHNRSVQARGHWFNTDIGLTLTPGVLSNEFVVPQTTIKADTTQKRLPYVRRGTRLYDPKNQTFEIAETSIDIDVVILLDYDDLPVVCIDYITALATMEFVLNKGSDQITLRAHEKNVQRTQLLFEQERIQQADYTLLDNPAYARIMGGAYRIASGGREALGGSYA